MTDELKWKSPYWIEVTKIDNGKGYWDYQNVNVMGPSGLRYP